ncbi:C40 family peptidase [Clostridium sp. SYSU_GA19001]|uniref:C40 family peptidase n=1 Tax=Clostridium caldaquaticum TaxID=2940653 RepID=UPI0020773559|nr:C40 family peptidase [Clostridium caldaquaticum]MCM8710360.1 C40 family peptidase [Clostridium caldaquaticum]
MNCLKTKSFLFVATLIALGVIAKINSYEVKADAAIKGQLSVAVRSASLSSNKTIKVPAKPASKTVVTAKKTAVNRGGSGLNQAVSNVSERSSSVVSYAYKFLGKPYIWGASGPNAFDCSGFTSYVYRAFGVNLPHNAASQYAVGKVVAKGDLNSGDLVFFNTYGGISHVGIYIGGGRFIHASSSKTGVIVSSLSEGYYSSRLVGAKRILK